MSDRKTTTIKLDEPIIGHEGVVREIILRNPRYAEYRKLGEPWVFTEDGKGRNVAVESDATIYGYIEECLEVPRGGALLLEQCGIADARKLRSWVFGFFTQGAAKTEGSTTSSPTSSSGSAPSP